MKIDVVTLFPEAFSSPLGIGLLGKAIERGLLEVALHDLRQWGIGPHRKVDDIPFGGGPGMVMAPGPIVEAVESIRHDPCRVILFSAGGTPLTQPLVQELSETDLLLVCGRYEGMDARAASELGAEELSIGQFVLSGGELPALCLIDAVSRYVPGVLGNPVSVIEESFSSGLLEHPQYTRPAEFRGREVPDVLLSGNHGRIAEWRRLRALRRTFELRPEVLDNIDVAPAERELIDKWKAEKSRSPQADII